MRDPLSWSFPIGRLFAIVIRVHILFPVLAAGLIMRAAWEKDAMPGAWIDVAMIFGLIFLAVFCHELGHCFAARYWGGEAREILLWPLGGLAYVDVPHEPRANFYTALWGPLVNLSMCLVTGLAMAFLLDQSYRPTWNPLWNPMRQSSLGDIKLTLWDGSFENTNNLAAVLLARFFYVNWIQFLFNVLVIGFPLDGGRMLQALLWPYVGFRQATLYAIYAGFTFMFVFLIVALFANEVLWLMLCLFIYTSCKQEWIQLETGGEESLFGYDFSQGYTSLERGENDDPLPAGPKGPPRKKLNFIQRWLQRRAAKKLQREKEQQEADDRRMDEMLEKIKQNGMDSLNSEERRFLDRMSHRYKNRP